MSNFPFDHSFHHQSSSSSSHTNIQKQTIKKPSFLPFFVPFLPLCLALVTTRPNYKPCSIVPSPRLWFRSTNQPKTLLLALPSQVVSPPLTLTSSSLSHGIREENTNEKRSVIDRLRGRWRPERCALLCLVEQYCRASPAIFST